MEETAAPRAVAAAWRPQLPGRRRARDIPDAIVEPEWGGLGVAAALTRDEAALYAHGEEVRVPGSLLRALRDAFAAVDAVIEGHLTTMALRGSEGAYPAPPSVERPSILVPQAVRDRMREDPNARARDHVSRALRAEPSTLAALEAGVPHAFVGTDLLWIDGQSLLDVPLLERKRLLETVLQPSHLVRVSVFVKPTAVQTLAGWGSLGFEEVHYRAANSRYLAGEENPDWTVTRTPRGPEDRRAMPGGTR
jgi:hypothetical protein